MVIPPKYSVTFAVETVKKNTSQALREKYQFLDKVYGGRGGIWSKGYCVSTVGIAQEIILRYMARGGKARKTRDKHSLNSERTPPVKASESIRIIAGLQTRNSISACAIDRKPERRSDRGTPIQPLPDRGTPLSGTGGLPIARCSREYFFYEWPLMSRCAPAITSASSAALV